MIKKILSVILCLILTVGMLSGCTLFVHNYERDYQRVVAEVVETTYSSEDEKGIPYVDYEGVNYYLSGGEIYLRVTKDTNIDSFKDKDGKRVVFEYPENLNQKEYDEIKDMLTCNDEEFTEKYAGKTRGTLSFETVLPTRKIYKSELANYVNSSAATYVNTYGYTLEEAVNEILESYITNRILLVNEALKYYASGKLVMRQADYNYIDQSVYASIDSELLTLQADILAKKDKDAPNYDVTDTEESEETTWPTPPEEEAEPEDVYNEAEWSIYDEKTRWPGMIGDASQKSLELESMRQFLIQLEDTIDIDFRMTAEQKERAKKDIEELREIQNNEGIEYVYPALGDKFLIDYIYRRNIMDTFVVNNLQAYIENEVSGFVTVTDEEIQQNYESSLKDQKHSFDEDIANYDTAISNEDSIYYVPDKDRYFFVKHILLQFSDEQTAALEEYKNNPNHTDKQIKDERAKLASEITAYKHVDGEDDTSEKYTVNQIFDEIKASVGRYASNPALAIKEFDRLIYKYNQDPGSFNKVNGYAVRTKLDEGENDSWVEEFSEAARSLFKDGKVGKIYFEPIVTDYGVHIMMYVGTYSKEVMELSDYTSFAKTQTYAQKIKQELFDKKASEAYTNWQTANVDSLLKDENKVKIYTKVFKDFYEA